LGNKMVLNFIFFSIQDHQVVGNSKSCGQLDGPDLKKKVFFFIPAP
jgi:hypothetical protein